MSRADAARGQDWSYFSVKTALQSDKFRLCTRAPLDTAMLLGRHLCIYPEPAVFEYGFMRRRGCFVPMRPVGKDGSIFTKNPNIWNFWTFPQQNLLILRLSQFRGSITIAKCLRETSVGP